jgi:hypothetical protein
MSRHEIENLYSLAVGVEIGVNRDSLDCTMQVLLVNQVFVQSVGPGLNSSFFAPCYHLWFALRAWSSSGSPTCWLA